MNKLGIFLRGMAMGFATLVPGISGGTIAFITGIYERLILAIKSIQITWIFLFIKATFSQKKKDFTKAKKSFSLIDWELLIVFTLGIVFVLVIGSQIISYILINGLEYLTAFFIGLIISSLFIIRTHITIHGKKEAFSVSTGLIIGILVSFLIPIGLTLPMWALPIAGFIGFSAMFFPGISGSHMLFVIGAYDFLIAAITNPFAYIFELFLFGIGGIISLLIVSRVISYLLKKYHSITLYVLIGLAAGTLIVPIRELIALRPFTTINTILLSLLGILGFIIPFWIEKVSKR